MDYICPGCGLARSEDEMTDDGALCRTCAQAIEAHVERRDYHVFGMDYDPRSGQMRFYLDGKHVYTNGYPRTVFYSWEGSDE